MNIVSHKLVDVPFVSATVAGGEIKPTLVCLHDTASSLRRGAVLEWFTSPECNVSAHVVVERDGTITQLVPFNRAAWHAGKSEWKGRQNCNSWSLGIEIVNPGKLDMSGKAWFKETFSDSKAVTTKEHGQGRWVDYTPEQIKTVTALCQTLVKVYPEITEIVGHYHISPGRKVDVNPLFPLEAVRTAAFGTVSVAAPVAAPEPVAAPIPIPVTDAVPPPIPTPAVAAKEAHAEVNAELKETSWFYNVQRGILKLLGIGTATTGASTLFASVQEDPVGTAMTLWEFSKGHPMALVTGAVVLVVVIEGVRFAQRQRLINQKGAAQ